mmetsp:Transcript_35511/g.50358  ORF Transcript_35511/g.50358 Transcript_35511/m.50358 type:complete len:133 (-) Transcript_35511:48-446(-)
MVCVPVFDSQGRVIAILQGVNKYARGLARRDSHFVLNTDTDTDTDEDEDAADDDANGKKKKKKKPSPSSSLSSPGFSKTDVSVLTVLASHIGVSLQNMMYSEQDVELELKDTIKILEEHGLAGLPTPKSKVQ